MSGTPGTFDGYHVWLGIPPAEQPPNHYRLLGIALFETDADVIDHAADRQMAHVRTFQSGKNGAVSQRLLNELSAARLCLLNAAKKTAYDEQLRAKVAAAPRAAPLMPPNSGPLMPPTATSSGAVPKATPVAPVAKAVPVAAPANPGGSGILSDLKPGGSGILSDIKPGSSSVLSGIRTASGAGSSSGVRPAGSGVRPAGSGSGVLSDITPSSGSGVVAPSGASSGSGVLSGIVPAASGSSASGSKVGTATVVGAKAVVGTKPAAAGSSTVSGGKTAAMPQGGTKSGSGVPGSGVRPSKAAAADLGLEVDTEAMDALTSSPDFHIELPRRAFSRDYAWKRPVALGIMAGVVAVCFFLVYMLGRSLMRNEELKQFILEGPQAASQGAPPASDSETGATSSQPPAQGQ